MSFSSQIALHGKATMNKIEAIRRGAALKLFSAVILDTPVLTGRLRGNWRISEGQPIFLADDRADPSGQAVISEVNTTVSSSSGDVALFLTNSLPYAARVEYDGWSHTKAPEGMVRRNVIRFNRLIQVEASQ